MTVVINGTTGIDTGTGSLIAADATTPTYLDLFEDTDNGSNYVRLIAPTSVAANRTITLPDGTGTVVVNNVSSALVSGTVNGGAANPLSGGTSVDFTGIPSWVKRITVMFSGVSGSGTSHPVVRLGTSSSFSTSGYSGSAAFVNATNATDTIANSSGFYIDGSTSAGVVRSGTIVLTLVGSNTWVESGTMGRTNSATVCISGGALTLSDVLTQVRITFVNGTDTFDAGTINILYE
jgi:hypothetical protein